MNSSLIEIGPTLGFLIVGLLIATMIVAHYGGLGRILEIPWAGLRGAFQLGIFAIILSLIIHRLWAVCLFVLVMIGVAAWTASGRTADGRNARKSQRNGKKYKDSTTTHAHYALICAIPVGLCAVIQTIVMIAIDIMPINGLSIIPVCGILIGNGMNVVSLTGRKVYDELNSRYGEVEAALALGFNSYDSKMMVALEGSSAALVPSLDSTKTVGLVTIPGAFVGMVLGGASVTAAAFMQLWVVVAILAVAVVANVLTTRLIAWGKL